MNNKALVEISVPAAGQKYDVFIPLESRMSDVIKMVAGAEPRPQNMQLMLPSGVVSGFSLISRAPTLKFDHLTLRPKSTLSGAGI